MHSPSFLLKFVLKECNNCQRGRNNLKLQKNFLSRVDCISEILQGVQCQFEKEKNLKTCIFFGLNLIKAVAGLIF